MDKVRNTFIKEKDGDLRLIQSELKVQYTSIKSKNKEG